MKLKEEFVKLTAKNRLYNVVHPVIGLTGGIATGKSTVAQFFQEIGVPVISADLLVKKVYTFPETIDFVKENWEDTIQGKSIDFQKLRKIVFSNDEDRERIETFIYARLPRAFADFYQKFSQPELMIYDVPLLFEKGLNKLVDLSLCVYSPRNIQVSRLIQRDCIDTHLANQIIDSQIDIEMKKKLADFIIDNTNDINGLKGNFSKLTKSFCEY